MTEMIDSATIISSLETAIELSDEGIVPGLQVEIVAMRDSGTFTFVMGLVFCISFYNPRSTIRCKSEPLKVLNDTKLILNNQGDPKTNLKMMEPGDYRGSSRFNLITFRTFRGFLFYKQETGQVNTTQCLSERFQQLQPTDSIL